MDEFPSGQRGQTVNLLRKLRWSESILVHQKYRITNVIRYFYVDEDGFGAKELQALFLDNILGSANAEQLKLEQFGSWEKE